MSQWLSSLFDGNYMPHGHCLLWQPDLLFMHVGSDIVITLAYFSIPAALAIIAYKRKDLGFNKLFWLFSSFIFACGTSHIVETINVWHGYYYIEGMVKVTTAAVSAATAIMLWPLVPIALKIPSFDDMELANTQLRDEIHLRKDAEQSLRELNHSLEQTVQQRTRELEAANQKLQLEIEHVNAQQSQLEAIMNGTRSLIFLKDKDLKLVNANKAFLDIYGFQLADIIGKTNHEIFPQQLADKYEATDRETINEKELVEQEATLNLNGTERVYTIEKYRLVDNNNECIGLAGIARDITDALEAQQNKAFLASIVEFSQDAIISKDLNSRITSWNPAAEAMFGYSEQELLGASIMAIIPEKKSEEENYIIESLRAGSIIAPFDTQRKKRNDELIDVSIQVSPILNNEKTIIGASTTIRDISARKKIEAQIQKKSIELEDANKALNEFVYIASHDLKAPLRGISNYAEFIQEDFQDKLPEEGTKYLEGIISLATKMNILLQKLLDYSRLGNREHCFETCSMNSIFQDAIARFYGERDVTFTLPKQDTYIQCDPTILTEAFANIFDNSIKYNHQPQKTIQVTTSSNASEHQIRIRDNGIGIPEDYFSDIFKIFYRHHDKKEFPEGSGAGLAIVSKIIQNHGGKVRVESSDQTGTTFLVTLPADWQGEENDKL